MSNTKTVFFLENYDCRRTKDRLIIIGREPSIKPYVILESDGNTSFIPNDQLERFAVNILKALGSKKLK